jgi:uncharacterized membrane protein AbrB (regulator of aidB expression)
VIEQVLSHFALIFFGALVTSLSSGGRRVADAAHRRRPRHGVLLSMPGGSGEMVNLGARNGAVLSQVAAGQSLRVLVVVLCVPARSSICWATARRFPRRRDLALAGLAVAPARCSPGSGSVCVSPTRGCSARCW